MSYNFRPKTEDEIKKLGITATKEKSVVDLFRTMNSSFGSDYDEFITIETGDANFGNVKILNDFKELVDIVTYRRAFSGIGLKFGNGSIVTSKAPTTQQQEIVTLTIFELLLSKKGNNYKHFLEAVPVLLEIYPSLMEEKSWFKSFELQFNEIEKATKLPNNTFDVYNRDGGFMDYISKLVKDKFQISKKDSWNPADIWLIRNSAWPKYVKALDDAKAINEVNEILVVAYNKMDIVGVSLKKNNGRQLNYDLVNLKSDLKKIPAVKLESIALNIPFDPKTLSFTSVTSNVILSQNSKKYSLGFKSNQASIGNITYEFSASGGAAFLGKVPKDMLSLELKKHGHTMPVHTDFMKFDRKDFEMKSKKIQQSSSIFKFNGDVKTFVKNLELSWSKGRAKDNVVISQIFTFAYIIATMTAAKRAEFIETIFYMAQKKGKIFGPFGKLH
jgi:hypothetical protein